MSTATATIATSLPVRIGPEEIDAIQKGLSARLSQFVDDHLGPKAFPEMLAPAVSELRSFLLRPGKRIRPLLFASGCRIFSPGRPLGPAEYSVASSLELFHAFVLIHDDIIDGSDTRRGFPSLHRALESRIPPTGDRSRTARHLALVLGDVLFALAQKMVLESGLPDRADLLSRLLTYVVDTGAGELMDIACGVRDVSKVDIEEIEKMYQLKTTRYTVECPLHLAGLLAGYSPAQLNAISAAAEPAGLAFQIENDLQEWERFEVSDSQIPSDIVEGKKTVLLRTAYTLLGETERTLLQLCLSVSPATDATLNTLRDLVASSGAVQRCRHRVEHLFALAMRRAGDVSLPRLAETGLRDLFSLVRAAIAGRGK